MTFTESLGRIQQIESTLTRFDGVSARTASALAATRVAAAATTATPSGGTAFADTLAAALGSGDTPGAADALGGLGTLGLTGAGAAVASPAVSGAASGGGVSGEQVATAAKRYVGVPYVWGGTDPAKGMDCSGFVQRVFKDVGIELPRVVSQQMKHGTPVASMGQARVGDLLISHGGGHIAIYLGGGKAIDAPMPGRTIQVRDAWELRGNLTAIRRIVPETSGVAAAGASAVSAAAVGPATARLDASQRHYAQVIVDEVRARGLPAQAAVNAISTALQESSLRMYWNPKVPGSRELAPDVSARGTDGYSVGLYQQQVHGDRFSWGTVADAMDPRRSTRMFLDRLTAIPGWQTMSVSAADQAVQRSAYPHAYAKWEGTARQVVAELYGARA
ncbi:C40 family peptidase [Terracoccus sp. 273MFTsu3.1]|uniref:C40 family peptidase n=1 Tax=Terracoccus sp. 273MFTsu3.1 TaxID=1172188 RepID=UPI0003A22DD7|nr:C40 family peptidase [Terracoccus sp. 273MFTsu3.1]